MNRIILPYSKARSMIQEADICLFRYMKGNGLGSWFITKAGEGQHVHVGLASWSDSNLELVEFREGNPLVLLLGGNGAGQGHSVALSSQVKKYDCQIDVYRASKSYLSYRYDEVDQRIKGDAHYITPRQITNELRHLTGQAYSWKTIWNMLKYNAFGLRLIYNTSRKALDDSYLTQNFFVCSTSVAYVYRKHFIDLVPNKSDVLTEPSDIARSSLLSYLFTLKWDG